MHSPSRWCFSLRGTRSWLCAYRYPYIYSWRELSFVSCALALHTSNRRFFFSSASTAWTNKSTCIALYSTEIYALPLFLLFLLFFSHHAGFSSASSSLSLTPFSETVVYNELGDRRRRSCVDGVLLQGDGLWAEGNVVGLLSLREVGIRGVMLPSVEERTCW